MSKKNILLFPVVLAAGILAGYTEQYLFDSDDNGNSSQPRLANRGQIFQGAPTGSLQKNKTHRNQPNETELDREIRRYASMDQEDLWRELEQLNASSTLTGNFTQSVPLKNLVRSYICRRLAQESPRMALEKIKNLKNIRKILEYPILHAWIEKNPEAALHYIQEQNEDRPLKRTVSNAIYLSALSRTDPEKAITLLCNMQQGSGYINRSDSIAQLAKKSPEKIREAVQKLKISELPYGADSREITKYWARADWHGVTEWIKTLPEENRDLALGTAVSALPLEEAVQKLPDLNEKAQNEVFAQILSSLCRNSSIEALDWITSHLTKEQLATITRNYNYRFNFNDPDFCTHVKELPAGTVKDSLLMGMVRNLNYNSRQVLFLDKKMEDTIAIINEITTPQIKEQALENTFNIWMQRDKNKARQLIDESTLSPDKKTKYRINAKIGG